jgi:hypothetical protein
MTSTALHRVASASLEYLAPYDHEAALTSIAAIETVSPEVWVVKTVTFRNTMGSTGWLVLFRPLQPLAAHPGGVNVKGFFCIDYVTEAAAFSAARTLAGQVAA